MKKRFIRSNWPKSYWKIFEGSSSTNEVFLETRVLLKYLPTVHHFRELPFCHIVDTAHWVALFPLTFLTKTFDFIFTDILPPLISGVFLLKKTLHDFYILCEVLRTAKILFRALILQFVFSVQSQKNPWHWVIFTLPKQNFLVPSEILILVLQSLVVVTVHSEHQLLPYLRSLTMQNSHPHYQSLKQSTSRTAI